MTLIDLTPEMKKQLSPIVTALIADCMQTILDRIDPLPELLPGGSDKVSAAITAGKGLFVQMVKMGLPDDPEECRLFVQQMMEIIQHELGRMLPGQEPEH